MAIQTRGMPVPGVRTVGVTGEGPGDVEERAVSRVLAAGLKADQAAKIGISAVLAAAVDTQEGRNRLAYLSTQKGKSRAKQLVGLERVGIGLFAKLAQDHIALTSGVAEAQQALAMKAAEVREEPQGGFASIIGGKP